ncbi:hypothetical protein IJJ08_01530 [bacterium]|nr:hypothetical protein [bacterium]
MKKALPYIISVLFLLIWLASFESLRQSAAKRAAQRQTILAGQAQLESLQLEQQQKEHELSLAQSQQQLKIDKSLRDTLAGKKPGEENLSRLNFTYTPREVPVVIPTDPDFRQQWHDLLWPL